MKFLVDAQLPRLIANWLNEAGHDALHTLDLPKKNLTPDNELIIRAMRDGRIVISKDADFVQSFLVTGEPQLSPISTGNISNAEFGKNTARQFGWDRNSLCFQQVCIDHTRSVGGARMKSNSKLPLSLLAGRSVCR